MQNTSQIGCNDLLKRITGACAICRRDAKSVKAVKVASVPIDGTAVEATVHDDGSTYVLFANADSSEPAVLCERYPGKDFTQKKDNGIKGAVKLTTIPVAKHNGTLWFVAAIIPEGESTVYNRDSSARAHRLAVVNKVVDNSSSTIYLRC